MKKKILVTDGLSQEGIDVLTAVPEFDVDVEKTRNGDELAAVIGDYHAIIIRSATKLTPDVIEKAENMKVIGRAGVGIDNINVEAANKKGIIVMNAPGGNSRSTAEHTFAMLLALSRNVPQACASMKDGKWDKKLYKGVEVDGKTLGLIGAGRIGRTVGEFALSFGMKVLAFDPHISEETLRDVGFEPASVDDMISRVDYITVHTPVTDDTRYIINKDRLATAQPGLRVINVARGGLVNEADLLAALENGQVAGAALDVFEEEPPTNTDLVNHPKVICTPHLGASTEEAQVSVAVMMAEQIRDALQETEIRNAVNIPYISPKERKRLGPFIELGNKLGRCAAQLAPGGTQRLDLIYSGPIGEADVYPVTVSALQGFLHVACGEEVNLVNAPVYAKDRGVTYASERKPVTPGYTDLVILKATTDKGELTLEGTVLDPARPRIVSVDGYGVDIKPGGWKIFMRNDDRPGMVGKIGTEIGKSGINISDMTLGRKEKNQTAVMVLEMDERVPEETLEAIRQVEGVQACRQVDLG